MVTRVAAWKASSESSNVLSSENMAATGEASPPAGREEDDTVRSKAVGREARELSSASANVVATLASAEEGADDEMVAVCSWIEWRGALIDKRSDTGRGQEVAGFETGVVKSISW